MQEGSKEYDVPSQIELILNRERKWLLRIYCGYFYFIYMELHSFSFSDLIELYFSCGHCPSNLLFLL